MNGLKNLIFRTVFYGTIAVFIIIKPAYTQILNIGIDFQKLNLPEQFLSSLENCKKHKHTQTATSKDIKTVTTYIIKSLPDGKCKLHVDGKTNISVHITQDCDLTLEQAKNYAQALRRYQLKRYSPRWDGEKIEQDADYLTAYKIMSNRKICRFKRDAVDNTKSIRINLAECKPAQQIEQTASLRVTRKIKEKQDDICVYEFMLQQTKLLKSTDNKNEDSKNITFVCNLNQEQRQQYLEILEALVVPEEEGYDYSAVQRISPAEEMNFLLDHCTFNTEP